MCCGFLTQGVQRALDISSYDGGGKPHLVVVRFILRRGQTNVQIEIREFEGGVRATGLLCLLGIGVGLGTFLIYKLCAHLHLKYCSSSPIEKMPISYVPSLSLNIESGISFGIRKIENSGILHRSQISRSHTFPQPWRKRIIDWLAKSTFSLDVENKVYCTDDEDEEDGRIIEKIRKKNDAMLTSRQSGWSSGFVSNPDNLDLSSFNLHNMYGCQHPEKNSLSDWQKEEDDEVIDAIDEESKHSPPPVNVVPQQSRPRSSSHRKASSNRHRRPNSGRSSSSISSDILGGPGGMRRNCYSFVSHRSGESSLYDYRESLVSKGFSVDLGENLEEVVLPHECEFTSCKHLSKGVKDKVDHMDLLQYELMKIRLDIDCMNQKFDDLRLPKDEKTVHHLLLEENLSEKKMKDSKMRRGSIESSVAHLDSLDGIETFDFIWDYHSDLASIENPAFVSARPNGESIAFEDNIFIVGDSTTSPYVIFEEENDNDDGDEYSLQMNDEPLQHQRLKKRKDSIVLFYFDDNLDDNFVGDLSLSNNLSQSDQNLRTFCPSNCNLQFLSNEHNFCISSSNDLTPPLLEKQIIEKLLHTPSHRSLKKSKVSREEVGHRIFEVEEIRVVGEEKKLFEHLEVDLHVNVMQISDIRKGYSKIFELWGPASVRSFRSDGYSILGPITFQVLLHSLPVLNGVGGNFQNSVQYLVAAIDNGHSYLMEWKYRRSTFTPKNEVLFKLINSLKIFCEQVCTLNGMFRMKCKEQYLASLLNHSPDMEVHLIEALKIIIMLRLISLFKTSKESDDNANIMLDYFGYAFSSPELVFKNFINYMEDETVLDDVRLSILCAALSTRVELFRPLKWSSDEFVRVYPSSSVMLMMKDAHSAWKKVSIIEDKPAYHYCLPAVKIEE